MFNTSDEFEFEFEKVICTDLLLKDHNNGLTVGEIDASEVLLYILCFVFLQ